jgi:hypothetical protein
MQLLQLFRKITNIQVERRRTTYTSYVLSAVGIHLVVTYTMSLRAHHNAQERTN